MGVRVEFAGRFSIAFGGGLGSCEATSTDCAEHFLERQKFKYKVEGRFGGIMGAYEDETKASVAIGLAAFPVASLPLDAMLRMPVGMR